MTTEEKNEHVLALEKRPCHECANFKAMPSPPSTCTKKLMGVTRDMFVTYYKDQGTCFETKQPKP